MPSVRNDCTEDCTLPGVNFSCNQPKYEYGGQCDVFLGCLPLADVTDLAEWDLRIDPTATTADAIRHLCGFVVIGEPSTESVEQPCGRYDESNGEYTMTVEVRDISDENYNFLRSLQKSASVYRAWTHDNDRIYGGNDGITGVSISGFRDLPRGKDDPVSIQYTMKWTAECSAERTLSPFTA